MYVCAHTMGTHRGAARKLLGNHAWCLPEVPASYVLRAWNSIMLWNQCGCASLEQVRRVLEDGLHPRTNRGGSRGGFIPAEILVQNGTTGDNGTNGGTLSQPVLLFLAG